MGAFYPVFSKILYRLDDSHFPKGKPRAVMRIFKQKKKGRVFQSFRAKERMEIPGRFDKI